MSYKTTQPSWCRREASALDAGKIQCSLGSGKFGQVLPDYLGELFPAHLFLLPRVDDPEFDNWYARGSLRWEATDNLEINAKYEYGDFESDNTQTVVYQSDFVGQENFAGVVPIPVVSDFDKGAGDAGTRKTTDTEVLALTIDWHMDFATLTSITSYSGYDLLSTSDTDVAAAPSLHRTRWEDFEQ